MENHSEMDHLSGKHKSVCSGNKTDI